MSCSVSNPASRGSALSPVRFSAPSYPPTFDPRQARTLLHLNIVRLLFSSPMRLTSSEEVQLDLAESIEPSQDGSQYRITLRKIFWPDGTPLTTKDVVYTWQSMLNKEHNCPNAHYLFSLKNGARAHNGEVSTEDIGLKAVSDRVLEVTLEEPCAFFLQLLATPAFCVVQKAYAEEAGAFSQGSIFPVSGPYTVQAASEKEIQLIQNNNYWASGQKELPPLYFRVTDDESAFTMFAQDQLDWIGSPLGSLSRDIPSSFGKSILSTQAAGTYFLRFNTAGSLLSDTKVRRAFSLAIDRKALVETTPFGKSESASSFTPPCLLANRAVSWSKEEQIWSAQSLFAFYCDEKRLSPGELTVSLLFNTADATNARIAHVVQNDLQQNLGVQVELVPEKSQEFYSKLKRTEYNISVCSWFGDYLDPHAFLSVFESAHNGTNNTHWESAKYQSLLQKSIRAMDPEERKNYLYEAEDVLAKKAPIAPLLHSSFNYLRGPAADGVTLSSLGLIDMRG